MTGKKSEQFETSLASLSTLVEKMETGDLTLEQSLNAFEEGVKLSKTCQSLLEKAEQKIETLIKNNDK